MNSTLYMKSLELENFRGFKELSIQLHPRLNVFLGNNGAGKSSILEAFNIALGFIIDELGNNSAVKTLISYDDIYSGANQSSISVVMYDTYDISWEIRSTPTISEGNKGVSGYYTTPNILKYIEKLKQYILYPQNKNNLPVFISYQATRNPNSYIANDINQNADFSSRACYDDAISMNPHFNTFFEWFKDREDLENETKVKNKDLNYTDQQLQTVRNAMHKCLGFTSFSIDRKLWEFNLKKNDIELSSGQLSDGEKGYLLLVADIARRLEIANPYHKSPLDGRGIVIIDEIELHLHPKWQRNIISQLLNTFPNCQFIVTTHSPQVVGEVPPESIWILEEGEKPYHPARSYGMDSNELLEEVMGAPSVNKDVSDKLVEIEKLIDNGEYEDARKKITALSVQTGKIPSLIGVNSLLTMNGEKQANIEV